MSAKVKVLWLLVMLLLSTYLGLAFTVLNAGHGGLRCQGVELVVRDSTHSHFVTKDDVLSFLNQRGLNPVGKQLDSVSTAHIEESLAQHPFIDRSECYKTPSGKVCIEVMQRVPILRIMASNGDNYYIDRQGKTLPLHRTGRATAEEAFHLPIATGHIEKAFSTHQLYHFGIFLQKNAFWRAQIQQINVLPGNTIELVPRVGDHTIYLGSLNDYEQKLQRVERFYTDALNKIGWNKYERINVELKNQIVCTKKK